MTLQDSSQIGKLKVQSAGKSVAILSVFLMWGAPVVASEPIVYEGFSSEQACKTFDEAPVCIAKTWKACTGFFGYFGAICPIIGLPVEAEFKNKNVKESWLEDEKSSENLADLRAAVKKEPWTLPYSQIVAAGNYEAEDIVSAIGPVGADRAGPGKPLPKILEGTVEIVMESYVEDTWTSDSIFVKRTGEKWALVAQHTAGSGFGYTQLYADKPSTWKEDCDAKQTQLYPANCAKFVHGLPPYQKYIEAKEYMLKNKK